MAILVDLLDKSFYCRKVSWLLTPCREDESHFKVDMFGKSFDGENDQMLASPCSLQRR